MKFYTGTSGIVLPVANKTMFPPEFREKSRLTYYAHLFNSLEVNSSFYKVPRAETVVKWAQEVPADFKFTYKLFRDITHVRNLDFHDEDVRKFMDVISQAGHKKGSLLVQFPPGLDISAFPRVQQLLSFIRVLDPQREWELFVEFRKRSWYTDRLADLLMSCQAGLVIHDLAGPAIEFAAQISQAVYIRFHGPAGDYRGSYDTGILDEYAGYIAEWLREDRTVFTYFNNTIGAAVANHNTLRQLVADRY